MIKYPWGVTMKNMNSLESLCGALCYALGIDAPEAAAQPNKDLCEYIDKALGGEKADRIFMYNPDAVAQWISEKYPWFMREVTERTDLSLPLLSVMPSVTPVCFGTMYTGAKPCVHGIMSYTKPVIKIDSIFDAILRSGKKAAIVCTDGDSMSKIYLEREIDYFFYDTIEEVNAKTCQLIAEDKYDFIAVYNGNYDSIMHKFAPESPQALGELRTNSRAFGMFYELIKEKWKSHNTLIGFSTDHGCHETDGDCGSHGLDMEEDLNILHFYKIIKKQ